MKNTYYYILEVQETASQEQIKAAYRAMVKKWHPDVNDAKRCDECNMRMQYINHAYSVLADPNSRTQYDALLRSIRAQEYARAQSYQSYARGPGNPQKPTANAAYTQRDPNPAPTPQPTGFVAVSKDIAKVSWQLFKMVFKATCTIVKYTFIISFFLILVPLLFSGNGYDDGERRY